MEWAFSHFLVLQEVFMVTNWLVDIEREIECRTKGEIVKSDALYSTRRFEYPWAFIHLPQRRGCKILDAGGGGAIFQFLLSLLNREVINMDLNNEHLEEVKKIKRKTGLFSNVETIQGDFTKTEYLNNTFDATVCISALEHGKHENIIDAVRELRRITDGSLMITLDVNVEDRPHREGVEPELLERLAHEYGFQVPKLPKDVMVLKTSDMCHFVVACIYLHGEDGA
jgi:ubiquinone/menaquinone biosynthesis C-methylase UbiE